MVSLWGSKQDGDGGDPAAPPSRNGDVNGDSSHPRASHDANERTRLLDHPPPPVHDGYLSPDDPAVSRHIECQKHPGSSEMLMTF